MVVDYIIVGLGLAGISLCEQLRENRKKFMVFDGHSQQASTVAGGVYNPMVLKRFNAAWKAEEQLHLAIPFYQKLEETLSCKLINPMPVYRKFASIEEQNLWFEAVDKPASSPFLSSKIIQNINPSVEAPYGFGKVKHSGRIAVNILQDAYAARLLLRNRLRMESLDYEALKFTDNGVQYKEIKAAHIVFAEGFGMVKNPFFNELPLRGAKGELLTIKAPELKLKTILKSSIFLIPLGNDHYKVGATYNWKDKTNEITSRAREELLAKLNHLISCNYDVVKQEAGIRPTVADRRPLVGRHPMHDNMYVLNGLGTRGTLVGPYVAKQLYDFIEKGTPLQNEIDIQRYKSRFR